MALLLLALRFEIPSQATDFYKMGSALRKCILEVAYSVSALLLSMSVLSLSRPHTARELGRRVPKLEQLFRLKVVYKVHASVLRCTYEGRRLTIFRHNPSAASWSLVLDLKLETIAGLQLPVEGLWIPSDHLPTFPTGGISPGRCNPESFLPIT